MTTTLIALWHRLVERWHAPADPWLATNRQRFGYHYAPGMGDQADEALQARAAERRRSRELALRIIHSQHARPDRERPRIIRGGRTSA